MLALSKVYKLDFNTKFLEGIITESDGPSEPCQASKIELFVKIVTGFQSFEKPSPQIFDRVLNTLLKVLNRI